MYSVYQTEGIVLGSINTGEANRYLYIFTREFGLIGAFAQGLRELKSKLRYSLQDFSHTEIDLVRGKSGWRVVNACNAHNYANLLHGNKESQFEIVVKISLLLRRLIKGEEKNEKLFNDITKSFSLLQERALNSDQIFNLEIITVMRALFLLGYWGNNDVHPSFLKDDITEHNLLDKIQKIKPLVVGEINKALRETQL